MFYDLFGAFASLCSTYYFIRKNAKAWPISLVAIAVNGWLYWQKGIYADMCLESFYFVSAAYGWAMWGKSTIIQSTQISKPFAWKHWIIIICAIGVLYELILFLLTTFTHSSIAKLDALTTSLSLVAQALMCHKMIATWILWFVADALYLFLYMKKALPFHSILMLIYTFMAITGYHVWRREIRYNRASPHQCSESYLNLSPTVSDPTAVAPRVSTWSHLSEVNKQLF